MNFTKYLELISVLLIVEKTNELLLKNHDLRPSRSIVVFESHAGSYRSFGSSKGRGCKQGKGFQRGDGRFDPYNRNITPENKIMISARSQLGSNMIYVIDVD